MLRKTNPIKSLRILTATDPSRLLAASKEMALTVQNIATSNAANSPT
jgi:hypothetical protein